jgi:5-formyltetrahydrofolate cyclo-ligase
MNKNELRILYKAKRNALSLSEKEKLEDLMLIRFQQLRLAVPDFIMTYSPITALQEFNPILIEDYCFFKNPNAELIYPVADTNTNTLKAYIVNNETHFATNKYGIDEPINAAEIEPSKIDLMIVPLLTFDKNGYRVGYGKGYYDKFIKLCNPNMLKIGFSFFDACTINDTNSMDEKLDFCITPEQLYEF